MARFLSRLLVLAAAIVAVGCMGPTQQKKQSPAAPAANGKGTIVKVLYADSSEVPDSIAERLSLVGEPPIREFKTLTDGKFAVGGLQDKIRYQVVVLEKGKPVGKGYLQKEDKEVVILLGKKTAPPEQEVKVDTTGTGDGQAVPGKQ